MCLSISLDFVRKGNSNTSSSKASFLSLADRHRFVVALFTDGSLVTGDNDIFFTSYRNIHNNQFEGYIYIYISIKLWSKDSICFFNNMKIVFRFGGKRMFLSFHFKKDNIYTTGSQNNEIKTSRLIFFFSAGES